MNMGLQIEEKREDVTEPRTRVSNCGMPLRLECDYLAILHTTGNVHGLISTQNVCVCK